VQLLIGYLLLSTTIQDFYFHLHTAGIDSDFQNKLFTEKKSLH